MNDQVFSINNDFICVSVNKIGAELSSVLQLNNKYEFIWNANPMVWNRHSPILFPIVGKLKDNKISINGIFYEMSQHGFARDCDFELINNNGNSLTFLLVSNLNTFEKYPFNFQLYIIYSFTETANQLKITYKIINNSTNEMPFSIGAHPGFKLPVADLNQYDIDFYNLNNIERYLLVEGLFNNETENIMLENHHLKLSTALFDKDAIVLKNCSTKKIALKHKHSNYEVSCEFNDFNDLGIWTKKGNQEFICLEPWLGFSDNINCAGEITNKQGMINLPVNATFEASYLLNFKS
ncbi:MAG: aldose 1-epimerase family protein [Bacteroidia bacterium]|nr:aldose 1-epimerase family protein [Bacteroidia bacterium]